MSGQQSQGGKGGGGANPWATSTANGGRIGSPPGAQFGMNPMMPFGQGGYGQPPGGARTMDLRLPPGVDPNTYGMGQQPFSGAGNTYGGMMGGPKPLALNPGMQSQYAQPGAGMNYTGPGSPSGATNTYQQMQQYMTGNGQGSGYQQGPMGQPKPLELGNYNPNGNPQVANFGNGLSLQEWQNMPASTRAFVPQPGSQDANRMDQNYADWVRRYGTPNWTG